jgi:hypothetical protein
VTGMTEGLAGLSAADRSVVEALYKLAIAEQDGLVRAAPMTIGPYSSFTLIGAIQLAWRHPSMNATQKRILENIARPMQAWFSGVLADALEAGWDTSQDRDPEGI